MEVELRLPLEVDMEPDLIRNDVLIFPELTIWTLSVLIRKHSANSDPEWGQTEVDQSLVAFTPMLWNRVGSYRSPGHNR